MGWSLDLFLQYAPYIVLNWIQVGRLRRPGHLFTSEMSIFPQPHHQLMLDGSCIVCGCSVQTEYEIFIRVGRHSATSMDDVCVQQTFVHLPIDLLIGVRKMIAPRLAVRTHHIEDNHILWAHVDHAESNSPAKFVDRQVRRDSSEPLLLSSEPLLLVSWIWFRFTVLRDSTCPWNLLVDYVRFGRRAGIQWQSDALPVLFMTKREWMVM